VGFYSRGAHGALLLYDTTNRESFSAIPQWLTFIREQSPGVQVLLFGNKIDLADARVIAQSEGELCARDLNIAFIEGSAKTAENVQDAFEKITDLLGVGWENEARGSALAEGRNESGGGCGC
jgi:GTPase SAR1 family protein